MRVCVIPARGGSKRIPRKNIRYFHGRPLIHYPIATARMSGLFDRIVCSTDDDEIAAVAHDAGAEVPFRRPAALADDFTVTADVLMHAIGELEREAPIDYICCLYPTAVFVQAQVLLESYQLMVERDATASFPVTTFAFPIFRAHRRFEDGRVEMFWPENMNRRSNDLPEAYHDVGQFYWYDVRKWRTNPIIYPADARTVVIPRYLVQDIDTLEDWQTAEAMFMALKLDLAGAEA
ncbi:MAG: pseudaminic acid cytidylyltransferase [Alphaproteobacteria bacterium]|nr:pseudaminic acid cytidylyltransferase [Alphaproteobacteria bacterium]